MSNMIRLDESTYRDWSSNSAATANLALQRKVAEARVRLAGLRNTELHLGIRAAALATA
jgi:hypothetical protein